MPRCRSGSSGPWQSSTDTVRGVFYGGRWWRHRVLEAGAALLKFSCTFWILYFLYCFVSPLCERFKVIVCFFLFFFVFFCFVFFLGGVRAGGGGASSLV